MPSEQICRWISLRNPNLLEWQVSHGSSRISWKQSAGSTDRGKRQGVRGKAPIGKRVESCTFASKKSRALQAQMTPTPGAFVCSKACEHRLLWMTNHTYSRELVVKLRRLLTWYFRVSVSSHAPKQCRLLLCRQRMAESRRQIFHHLPGTWPSNKELDGGSHVIWENSGVHACGGICDLVYRDRYIQKKHCSCDIVPEDASSVASRHSRVLFLRSAGNAWQELKWRCSWISELRLQDLKAVTFHFWALQEDGTPHKVTLSLAFFQVPPFLAVLISSELLSCVQGPDMSIPTCSSEKSPRSGTEFLEGRKLNFLASKQHQIALMKHQAAFESEILGSRPCCGWQDVTPEWVPVMPNWPHTRRVRRPSEDRIVEQKCNFYSSNFASTCAHVREAEHRQEESWKLREQWGRYRFKYETQCCLGHLGQGVASEKECLCSVCFFLLSETVAPLLFLLKHSGARWCHPNVSLFGGSTIYLKLIYKFPGEPGAEVSEEKRTI